MNTTENSNVFGNMNDAITTAESLSEKNNVVLIVNNKTIYADETEIPDYEENEEYSEQWDELQDRLNAGEFLHDESNISQVITVEIFENLTEVVKFFETPQFDYFNPVTIEDLAKGTYESEFSADPSNPRAFQFAVTVYNS